MTIVYSGGDHAAAIAGITAAINERIITNADGTKSLDGGSLAAWLQAQFNAMVGTEATSTTIIAGIDVNAFVASLNAKIRKEVFATRSDYPGSAGTLSQTDMVAAAKMKFAELKSASDAVGLVYADLADESVNALTGYFEEAGILAGITKGTDRMIHDRAYIVTYVSDRGEISKPSDASVVIQVDQNDTVTVTVPAPPAGRNITHFRLYRATSGTASAAYLYVPCDSDEDGWPIGTLTIVDSKLDSELQESCPSLTWDEPPADLRGLIEGSNGSMAGFTGNTFVPCVNFHPYAFPTGLRRTTRDPIVGLGHFGDTWVVCTRGVPYFATGSDTQLLDFRPAESSQACVAQDSIVSFEGGVVYASPDGLQMASASGVNGITDEQSFNLFTREEWQALEPASIVAVEWEGHYLFKCTGGVYLLNLKNGRLGTVGGLDGLTALYRDLATDTVYGAIGTTIKALFSAVGRRTARWRGKMAELDGFGQFSFLRVKDGQNKALEAPVTVRIYDGPALIDTKVVTGVKAVRVKPNRIGDIAVEVESAGTVSRVTMASSASGLQ